MDRSDRRLRIDTQLVSPPRLSGVLAPRHQNALAVNPLYPHGRGDVAARSHKLQTTVREAPVALRGEAPINFEDEQPDPSLPLGAENSGHLVQESAEQKQGCLSPC